VVDLRGEKDIEQLRLVALAQRTQIDLLVRSLREALKDNPMALQQALLKIEEQARKERESDSDGDDDDEREGDASTEGDKTPRKKRTKFGPTAQTKLDVVEPPPYELDDADKICPCCGGVLHPMEGQFEESEMIDVVAIRYELKKIKQQKYVCECGGAVETAPGPERVVPGSRYSLAFAIAIAIAKYLDHIPLARQERMMRRRGLEITTQTLWDLINGLARRLEAPNRELLNLALAQPVIGLDQTGWKRLEGGGKKWQMWCITAPGIVVHRIKGDKSAATFEDLVGAYKGVIVCDALKTHEAGVRGKEDVSLAGCWAHVFRKFEEALADHSEANVMLEWIHALYAIDEEAGDDLERRAELRRTKSVDILELIKAWLWAQAPLQSLSIGKAAAYVVSNWARLTLFVDDARIPLDNNGTERGIRGPVVGRRNHFGSKSQRGTEVASLFYTLIETAKLHGVDVATYLYEAALAASRDEVLLPGDLKR
jgi:transposase